MTEWRRSEIQVPGGHFHHLGKTYCNCHIWSQAEWQRFQLRQQTMSPLQSQLLFKTVLGFERTVTCVLKSVLKNWKCSQNERIRLIRCFSKSKRTHPCNGEQDDRHPCMDLTFSQERNPFIQRLNRRFYTVHCFDQEEPDSAALCWNAGIAPSSPLAQFSSKDNEERENTNIKDISPNSWKTDPRSGQTRQTLHFTVGYSFFQKPQ